MNIFFELSFRDLDKNYLSGLVRNFDGRQKDSHVILINLFNGYHFFSLANALPDNSLLCNRLKFSDHANGARDHEMQL